MMRIEIDAIENGYLVVMKGNFSTRVFSCPTITDVVPEVTRRLKEIEKAEAECNEVLGVGDALG